MGHSSGADLPEFERPPVIEVGCGAGTSGHIPVIHLSAIPEKIVIPRLGEVYSYLAQHSDLAEELPGICERCLEEFGEGTEISLEVYHDPEIDDRHLTVYVRQANYEKSLMERIDNVWAFFASRLSEISGWLVITTDFRPPKWKHGF